MIYLFNRKNLQYKKMGTVPYVIVLLVVGIGFFSGWMLEHYKCVTKMECLTPEEKIIILRNGDDFSKKKFIKYIDELNLKYPEVVYAHSKEECGFKSPIFLENHNLFGMNVAKQRPTCNIGEQSGLALYHSWRESVQDYSFYYASYLGEIKNKDQYYQLLSSLNYSETPDSLYIGRVRGCEKEYFDIVAKMKESGEWELDSYSISSSTDVKK